ncbi:MAG TPA: AAA family ATPase, partial [Acidimicrobiales bacterium]
MAPSFRFEPPAPRPGSLTRPRLLRVLLGRWDHRVTAVVGGPGLGKTTLLAQAVAENKLAPRGQDVWLGLATADADGDTLARDALAAVTAYPGDPLGGLRAILPGTSDELPEPEAVAEAVWRRSPVPLCLVIDDAHWLTPGSAGATWLATLVDSLPNNGHVLLASRWAPPIPLARLATQGDVLRLMEDDLRFSGEELV